MENVHQMNPLDRSQRDWRSRLNSAVAGYCATNDVSPEDAVDFVSDCLRSAPASVDRLTRAELRHRVRNEMQLLISSMRQRRRTGGSEGNAGCNTCIGQVVALSNLNDALDCDGTNQRVDLAVQVARIASDTRRAFDLDENIRFVVEVVPLLVSAEIARNVVLILNEALTNAIKHAFGDDGGTVRIRLQDRSSTEAELMVTDDGGGSATSGDRGSGGSLVDALAAQIDASIHRTTTGTGFRLSCTFPTA